MLPTVEQLAAVVIREYFTFEELSSLLQENKDIFFTTEQNYSVVVYDQARIFGEPRKSDPEMLVVFTSEPDLNEDAITIPLSKCKDV